MREKAMLVLARKASNVQSTSPQPKHPEAITDINGFPLIDGMRGSRREHRSEPQIQWQECPLIQAREYPAYCKWARSYRDPGFHRWVCLMRWDVLTDDLTTVIATVPYWLAISRKEKPTASKRGKYLREWVRANGAAPARGDRLSPRVFVHRFATVEVGDTDPAKSPVPYSVVKRIVRWETGGSSGHSITKSHNQDRQGIKPVARKQYRE